MANTTSSIGNLPINGFVRESQLIPTIVPFSSATLWRKVKAGTFPKPKKLSARVTAWEVGSIRNWLADPVGFKA